jgi:hypothetical protein
MIKFGGAAVTAGEFGPWAPIGAEQIAGGYEVAWKVTGADQYTVWTTDGDGNMLSNLTGVVSGSSHTLQSYEPSFHQDLNNDGAIGPASMSIQAFLSGSAAAGNDGSAGGVALLRNYIASTFATPAGQGTGTILAAPLSDTERLAKPLA